MAPRLATRSCLPPASKALVRPYAGTGAREECGFSLVELMIVIALGLVVVGVAVPSFVSTIRSFRVQGDARDMTGEILLAKMRAAANFTRARVYFDRSGRTWRMQLWNKTTNQWVAQAGTIAQPLSTEINFGFGSIPGPPPGTQATLAQAPLCRPGTAGNPGDPGGGSDIANTSCIVFNSRGVPVDNAGTPNGDLAIYITDGADAVYGTTVSITGVIQSWRISLQATSATDWVRR